MKLAILGFVALAVGALAVCFAPLVEAAYTVTVEYEDIETYYETEPYEVQVTEPLDYEILQSYIDSDTFTERHRLIIGGVVFQDEIVEVTFPIGCVTLQNIDTVPGTFGINFSFYAKDKLDTAILGGLDGFDFEKYLALDDEARSDYLDKGTYDEEVIRFFGEKYNGYESHNLELGEVGTAKYSVQDINIDEDAWFWEFKITPDTKTVTETEYGEVEKQRTVTKERLETRYKNVTLLDYLLHY